MAASDPRPKLLVVEDDEGLARQLRWSYEDYDVLVARDCRLIPTGPPRGSRHLRNCCASSAT